MWRANCLSWVAIVALRLKTLQPIYSRYGLIMKKIFFSFVSIFTLFFAAQASAVSLLGQAPDSSKIYTAGNGLEWVYAGPCAGLNPSCGTVQLHSGFNFATAQQWTDSFADLAALIAAFDLNNYSSTKCASAEFNVAYDHCDPSDVLGGYVWNSPLVPAGQASHPAAETFLVRGASVPEPSAFLLLGLGLLGLGLARRVKA